MGLNPPLPAVRKGMQTPGRKDDGTQSWVGWSFPDTEHPEFALRISWGLQRRMCLTNTVLWGDW